MAKRKMSDRASTLEKAKIEKADHTPKNVHQRDILEATILHDYEIKLRTTINTPRPSRR